MYASQSRYRICREVSTPRVALLALRLNEAGIKSDHFTISNTSLTLHAKHLEKTVIRFQKRDADAAILWFRKYRNA